jgi:uncharacterized spore protein YtfJ
MSSDPSTADGPGTAAHTARPPADELLAALADRIGAKLTTSTLYGTPIERDGVTVVPVGAARFALGGGGGSDRGKAQEGAGGGGAATVTPVRYIELKDGRSRFVPLVRPARMLAVVCCTMLAGLIVMRPAAVGRRASVLPWR